MTKKALPAIVLFSVLLSRLVVVPPRGRHASGAYDDARRFRVLFIWGHRTSSNGEKNP